MGAAVVPRHYIVMEVKSNLVAAERKENLKRFTSPCFKKIAQVVMGQPPKEWIANVQETLLKQKQAVLTAQHKQAQLEKQKKKAKEKREKELAKMRKKAEAETKKRMEAAKKKKEEEAAKKKAEEEKKKEGTDG